MSLDDEVKNRKKQKRKVDLSGKLAIIDYAGVDAELLLRTIARVAARNGALRFGYSRDGTQYAVGVYGDGDPYTLWSQSYEELDRLLAAIGDGFDPPSG